MGQKTDRLAEALRVAEGEIAHLKIKIQDLEIRLEDVRGQRDRLQLLLNKIRTVLTLPAAAGLERASNG